MATAVAFHELQISHHHGFIPCSRHVPLSKSYARRNRKFPIRQLRRKERHLVRAGKWRWNDDETFTGRDDDISFENGVSLFNSGRYYECHDVMEGLWNHAREPQRGTIHGILQVSVALYHLLNQNHKGAMMELGEGLTKIRRNNFTNGPFFEFEKEVEELLEFVYNTQLEYAACIEDYCIAMDGSEESYKLLGNFGAGQALYELSSNSSFISFRSQLGGTDYVGVEPPPRVKVPTLKASEIDLQNVGI